MHYKKYFFDIIYCLFPYSNNILINVNYNYINNKHILIRYKKYFLSYILYVLISNFT